jgi:cytochrome c-type biogenesis protein
VLATVQTTVTSGSSVLAALLALAAGLLSFFSPCVLPLVPGYIAFLGGSTGASAAVPSPRARRGRTIAGAVAFIIGFSFVFVSLGTVFGGVGRSLKTHSSLLNVVFGAITIVFGLFFAGWLPRSSILNREVRIHWLPSATVGGGAILGVLFGVSWTPCTGPTLGAIIGLAEATPGASAWRGALLAAVYCIGLGLPFLAAAVAADTMTSVARFARRHTALLLRVGGLLLISIGVLEVTGTWATCVQWLQDHVFSSFTSPI